MKLISARSQIRESVTRFETAMSKPQWANARWTMGQKHEILKKLKALDLETATVEEVNIITEIPYVSMTMCDQCKQDFWDVIELGETLNDDYGASYVYVCQSCLKHALTRFTTLT